MEVTMAHESLLQEIGAELARAEGLFPPFNSSHEGYAVLLEEVDELWHEVKNNKGADALQRQRREAVQVAAMACRFLCMIDAKLAAVAAEEKAFDPYTAPIPADWQHVLEWQETYDDIDRHQWEAASIYCVDDAPLHYRITMCVADARVWFILLHSDEELVDRQARFGWLTNNIEQAKQLCQRLEDEAVAEMKSARGREKADGVPAGGDDHAR